jgi:hypothetical protein
VLVLAAERIGPLAEWLRRPGMAVGMVVAADILLLTLVAATSDGGLVTALGIAWENLFASSYFNLTWWWAAGVVIVGLLLSATGSRREWLPLVLLVVVQFFVVAFTVHGMLHHGRSGWSDSFTRVSFHIVPVLFWLFALEFGEVADRLGGARAVSRVSEGESPSESEGSRPAAASE